MAAARLFELSRQLPAGTTELPFDAPVTSLILWSLGEILDLSQRASLELAQVADSTECNGAEESLSSQELLQPGVVALGKVQCARGN